MSIFESLIHTLQAEMETPVSYGLWHIAFLLLIVTATVLLAWRFRNASDATLRKLLAVIWIILVALEIYKQLVYSVSIAEDGTAVWDFQWYAFPFQFCSTPLYALPFVIWLKDGRLRDAVMAFLATYSLFAGVAVMLYPGDVFIGMIGINIQTMVHHGSQVVLGVLMAVIHRNRLDRRFYLGGLSVFAGFAAVAMILNITVHHLLTVSGLDETFNMFFISPYYECTLPVLSAIEPLVPYPLFLLIYLVGFAAVSGLILAMEKGIVALVQHCHRGLT